MNIAKLSISYDRGVSLNKPDDVKESLGLFDASEAKASAVKKAAKVEPNADGKVVRGLGTHYRTPQDAELVALRDADAKRIYTSWRETFLTTPIEGVYAIPHKGAAKAWVAALEHRDDIEVRCSEFELSSADDLTAMEIEAWAGRIQNQLSAISLGRSKEADSDGLNALITLAGCPVLGKDTADRIKELVAMVREGKMDRLELKRQIKTTKVKIEQKPLVVRRNLAVA